MALSPEGIVSAVFLGLYIIGLAFVGLGFAKKAYPLKSKYAYLLAHCVVRVAAQAAALAFGITGISNSSAFTAYLILGAQGYFFEILAVYRFLVGYQLNNTEDRQSWIMPTLSKEDQKTTLLVLVTDPKTGRIAIFQSMMRLLSIANILLIIGGALNTRQYSGPDSHVGTTLTVKVLRGIGQGFFLVVNVVYILLVARVVKESRSDRYKAPRLHPALVILIIVWPFLVARGIYGLLSAIDYQFSYLNPANYDGNNLTSAFVTRENVLGVTMEFITFVVLLSTSLTTRYDLHEPYSQEQKVQSTV